MNRIELLVLNLAQLPAEQLPKLEALLSACERAQLQTFSHLERRRQWLVARALLRVLLDQRLGADSWQLHHSADGKPQLLGTNYHFNLSHSGDYLALALCADQPIGLDLELGKEARDPLKIARRFFAESETAWLESLDLEARRLGFYRLWARKEAVLKANGCGIKGGLERVIFAPECDWQLTNRLDQQPYQIHDAPFASGFIALAAAAACTIESLSLAGSPLAALESLRCEPHLFATLLRELTP